MNMSYVQKNLKNSTDSSNQFPGVPLHPPVEAGQHRTPNGQHQPDTPKISKQSDRSSPSSEVQSQIQVYAYVSEGREKSHIEAESSPVRLVNRSVDSGVKSNLSRYLKWLEESANEGIALAQFSLAEMYLKGQGVDQDDKQAFNWFSKAAGQGITPAQYALGMMYFRGQGVGQDDKQAFNWFSKAAGQGYAPAQYELGMMYFHGRGVDRNFKQAFDWFSKAAGQGFDAAQQALGIMYFDGQGVDQDDKQAFNWFSKAAGQGITLAQHALGIMYFDGQGVGQDYKQAFNWFSKAAGQGYAPAQHVLGIMYFDGQGVGQDDKQAFNWFSKAAGQGYAPAQHELGLMYFHGRGVDRDVKQAFDWVSKAAGQSFDPAQYELGLMYFYGHGTKQDRKKAMEWHLKAAAQGNDKATYHLGMMYFSETSVHIAFEKAIEWIGQAAENGKKDAQSKLAEIYSTDPAGSKDLKLATYWKLKSGIVKSGEEIQLSKIPSAGILKCIPDTLNNSHEFKNVHKLELKDFVFDRTSIDELSHLIKFGTGLKSILVNVEHPPRKGINKSVKKLADLIREENTQLTEFTVKAKKINRAVELQINQILQQNSCIGELRRHIENHRPARSDELPLEVLEHQADQLIIHNIRRGQTMAFTQAALDEFLMSAQYHQMLDNTVQVSRPPVLPKNTAQ
jgi:TPR repeat protein